MGTYCYIRLKDSVSNEEVKRINEELKKIGFPGDAFHTEETMAEIARYMNEEPEGLKQFPHINRPISVEFVKNIWSFDKIRQFCAKFLRSHFHEIGIVAGWANRNTHLVDFEESENWTLDYLANIYEEVYNICLQYGCLDFSTSSNVLRIDAPLREAIHAIVGEYPPVARFGDMSGVYHNSQLPDDVALELSDWLSENALPKWATGSGTLEAAEHLVATAVENGNIQPHPTQPEVGQLDAEVRYGKRTLWRKSDADTKN